VLAADCHGHAEVAGPGGSAGLDGYAVLGLPALWADWGGMVQAPLDVFVGRGRAALWRPLLAEGLIGSGQIEHATVVLDLLRSTTGQVSYLQSALAWLQGWLAEQQGDTDRAQEIYQRGEQAGDAQSPVYTARLLLAHGRLLRRTGQRPSRSSACAGRTTSTWPCEPSRSWPAPGRNWRRVTFRPAGVPSTGQPSRLC
jgi:hypothetical protein